MKQRKRRYIMKNRGRKVELTRERIVEATVALHEEVGPNRTTVSAIAERAGVERLTVYRHFPDERAVLNACSAAWLSRNPPPDPEEWRGEGDAATRTRNAFFALAEYYSGTQRMLEKLYQDVHDNRALADVMRGFEEYLEGIASELAGAWNLKGGRAREARAIIGHGLAFSTWSSLEDKGIGNRAKARLLGRWVESVGTGGGSD